MDGLALLSTILSFVFLLLSSSPLQWNAQISINLVLCPRRIKKKINKTANLRTTKQFNNSDKWTFHLFTDIQSHRHTFSLQFLFHFFFFETSMWIMNEIFIKFCEWNFVTQIWLKIDHWNIQQSYKPNSRSERKEKEIPIEWNIQPFRKSNHMEESNNSIDKNSKNTEMKLHESQSTFYKWRCQVCYCRQ